MRGTMLYGRRDVRFEERPDPTIIDPTVRSLQVLLVCSREMSTSQMTSENSYRKRYRRKMTAKKIALLPFAAASLIEGLLTSNLGFYCREKLNKRGERRNVR